MSQQPGLFWRFQQLDELTGRDWETAVSWLSVDELANLQSLADPRRQQAGLAGRYLARKLLREQIGGIAGQIDQLKIVSWDAERRRTPPRVLWRDQVLPCALSIAHTRSAVLVALSTAYRGCIGVDLVQQQPLLPGFARAWLDDQEKKLAEAGDPWEIHRLWAVKEAVYKTAFFDQPFRPRNLRVRRYGKAGYRCLTKASDRPVPCCIRTWEVGGHVAALVTDQVVAELSASDGRATDQIEVPLIVRR